MHRYTEEFARHGTVAGQVLLTLDDVTRRSHYRNASRRSHGCSSSAWCRSSTRTTRSPPPRSGSVTTTGSRPWSRTWCTPTCWCCSPTSTVCTTGRRRAGEPARSPTSRTWPRLDGVVVGRAGASGVGTGGMQTKLEAARIATGAGIPVVLTSAEHARATRSPDAASAPCSTRPAAGGPPGSSGWPTRPRPRAHRARRRCRPRAHRAAGLAAAGRHHRRHRRRSWPATRSTCWRRTARWSPAGWSTTTPAELPALLGRSTRDLARELGAAYEREVVHRDDLVVLTR